jgi:tetratricopeptide (TPR) repeat protein
MTGRWWLVVQAVLLAGWLGVVQACSGLPRIVVLHDPLTPQKHVTLGESYLARSLWEPASREFNAALRQQPEFVPALIGLGNLAFETNALEEAERFYRRALAAAPGHPGAGNNLALVNLARGERLNEAEGLARSAAERGGAIRPYALDTLARIYMRQGRYREAGVALEEAAAMVPAENRDFHQELNRSRQELAVVYFPEYPNEGGSGNGTDIQ